MSEKAFDVRVIGVNYVCDGCNNGLMEHTNMALMTDPPQYPHQCTHCGAVKNLLKRYPYVRYEEMPK